MFGWLWLRQARELAATRLRAELESAHAAELRAEAERRTAAETLSARLPETETLLRVSQEENSALSAEVAELQTLVDSERRAHVEQQRLLQDARGELSDAFKALSADALRHNNQSFLELANTHLSTFQEAAQGDLTRRQQAIDALVRPMRESLDKVDTKINALETARAGAYQGLTEQVRGLLEVQHQLRGETANLVNALRRRTSARRGAERASQMRVRPSSFHGHSR